MTSPSRRAFLLGGAALALSGCETIDSIFGESKTPLPGERLPLIQADRDIEVDPALAGQPVALPVPAALTEWPTAGGNLAHDPGHALAGEGLREAWRASIGTGSSYRRRITSGPILANGTVFTADAYGTVSATDATSGGRRWTRETTPEKDDTGAVGAGLAFSDGTLYAATGMAEVLAMDPGTGEIRWRASVPAPTRGGIAVSAGRIFVPTVENQLLALSTEDGRTLWTYRGSQVGAVPLGLPAPAVEGETVVAGFPSGELAGLRVSDGRAVWTESLAASGPDGRAGTFGELSGISGLPVIHDGRVIATGQAGNTLMVDLRAGRRLWERDVGSARSPAVAGDWIFLVTPENQLVAMGRADGRVRWLAVLDERSARDRRRTPASFGSPLVAGGRILVPSTLGELLLVDPADGKVAGRIRLPGGASLPMIAVGGTIYLVTDDGVLVALRGA
ncbi:PQQ-binding-like beta-propeller repeat protein [Pararoseomonas indoligenes]|uniref:PQQ-binding-like beta-propeller repeat protein n=1 Tax=Roseomonas indoligenes TaxID=2820811 RepID=A0A940MZ99_9PROT|nr:PQQ-binding-like beta-propeller repeat protein [Pararoseomonas indoligenes]MBP0491422.1 PQQ-binding-like beta-propeller repeat protein [Pararoseomonas indoligenes]